MLTAKNLKHSLTYLKRKNAIFEQYLQWELNPHYHKFKAHGSRLQDIIEKTLMRFNDPKSHGIRLKAINILCLILKVTNLATFLERYENLRCFLKLAILSVSRYLSKYNGYLKAQRIRIRVKTWICPSIRQKVFL